MIVQRCPDVLLKNIDETNDKYEYVFFQVRALAKKIRYVYRWALRLNNSQIAPSGGLFH